MMLVFPGPVCNTYGAFPQKMAIIFIIFTAFISTTMGMSHKEKQQPGLRAKLTGLGDTIESLILLNRCNDDYSCPNHSFEKYNRNCHDSFGDCECEHGYRKSHDYDYCVKEWCEHDYYCPHNSFPKPNRACYNNFNDCECEHGYRKSHNSCQEE
mmetsp:Transcript_43929/g.64542  ORF Transcript_43929/g.64542 Transcript_43929/m.64542 type:complete len:154 (-) Transcript_43929:524-985(-)